MGAASQEERPRTRTSFGDLGSSLPDAESESLFTETARRLGARAVGNGFLTGSAPPDSFYVSCERKGLNPGCQRLLEGLGSVSSRPVATDCGRVEIWGSLAVLETLAEEDETLALLFHTARNARRAPRAVRLMGILNVTPDSFSDGGSFLATERAIEHGLKLLEKGAEMLDVGGESTRPGSTPVSPETERERTLPVVEGLRRETRAPISIDTTKASVARAALAAGASIVNDISAGRFDEEMLSVVAEHEADIVLMHLQNTPRDMQARPSYRDVVSDVAAHLTDRVSACLNAGIGLPKIAIDPGIGFGKRLKDNLELVRSIPELRSLGLPIVLGVSRKSFLGAITGEHIPSDRDAETLTAIALGCAGGAEVHRVHDVARAKRALQVTRAVQGTHAVDGFEERGA